uniref:DUF834 domain-containing protein n=1 Tax=Oryza glaberrima TaxID=4538 RepID=I1P4H9_ORYGL
MAAVVHMASGGGQPYVGEGRRHSGRLWMRGLASVAAATAAVCGGGGDVGGGEGVGCEARMATARWLGVRQQRLRWWRPCLQSLEAWLPQTTS